MSLHPTRVFSSNNKGIPLKSSYSGLGIMVIYPDEMYPPDACHCIFPWEVLKEPWATTPRPACQVLGWFIIGTWRDHPMTCKWLIWSSFIIHGDRKSPFRIGLWDPFQMGSVLAKINRGDPNHLLWCDRFRPLSVGGWSSCKWLGFSLHYPHTKWEDPPSRSKHAELPRRLLPRNKCP